MKLVTAAQQLHGILDNTANNKVLECELRLQALQTILYDNITHVSSHVAPPPSLDIVSCLPVSGVKGTDRPLSKLLD